MAEGAPVRLLQDETARLAYGRLTALRKLTGQATGRQTGPEHDT